MIKKTLCFSNPAYLSLRDEQLVIKLPEVEKTANLTEDFKKTTEVTRPIEDIGVVVLDHKQITITQGALEALLENNCAVITCDSSHMPVGLLLPLVGNTTQNERFRDQLDASLPLRKQLWQQTMQQKIRNQAAVLSKCSDAETKGSFRLANRDKERYSRIHKVSQKSYSGWLYYVPIFHLCTPLCQHGKCRGTS